MTAASRSLATALWGARFASGLLPQSYTTTRDTTQNSACVIVAPRQSSPRRDRQNGHPDCRCLPIQIVALQKATF